MSGETGENRNESREAESDIGIETAETAENTYVTEVPADDPEAFWHHMETPPRPEPPKDDDTERERALAPARGGEHPPMEKPNPWLREASSASTTPEAVAGAAEERERQQRQQVQEMQEEQGRQEKQAPRNPAAAGLLPVGKILDRRSPEQEQDHGAPPKAPGLDRGRRPEQGPGLEKGL
ncbi:hypothetical protein YW5DRAFT_03027 [Streptomyces sp. Ncost-T6T-1]|uniref:hypothetical protein n=1 Tax=Streptomyces sp. Ncost-T6T-1 TaxID=1100828 RepID=UPI000804D1FF|nr:hypothetical protein [Streptomyces sp. Ncost-T6T-1]SBV05624.1 hypothetical protein YW5DRAFT_03027 [Streptomyces sp. Ncost-T6T-1]